MQWRSLRALVSYWIGFSRRSTPKTPKRSWAASSPLRRSSDKQDPRGRRLDLGERQDLRNHLSSPWEQFRLRLYQSEWVHLVERLVDEEDPEMKARLQGKLQGLRRAVELPYMFLDREVEDGRGRERSTR